MKLILLLNFVYFKEQITFTKITSQGPFKATLMFHTPLLPACVPPRLNAMWEKLLEAQDFINALKVSRKREDMYHWVFVLDDFTCISLLLPL